MTGPAAKRSRRRRGPPVVVGVLFIPGRLSKRTSDMARLIIMGPPGSGKGTQGEHIARHFGIPAISTGDLFRAHVRDKTDLGLEAGGFMDRGEFVPDHVTTDMLKQRMEDADAAEGFLLDGYPRTVIQIGALDEMLAVREQPWSVLALTPRTASCWPECSAVLRSRVAAMTLKP